ncbi:MAG TPA: glycosyltransferase family 2 protein [Allosphingosinicella sp.]|jgi:GT2 family glycosyltransferase
MTRPLVTVVIETITARLDTHAALAEVLAGPIRAVEGQTYPSDRIETILVVDDGIAEADIAEIGRRYPHVAIVRSEASNYFAAKNSGAARASGDYVMFLDGDCVPEPDCLEQLIRKFETGVAVVAGCVRYTGRSWTARILSVPDFAYIVTESDGQANGLNLSNAAFRRDVLAKLPLDERVRRDGGCYQLFHRIRAAGGRALYEPRAIASHGIDVGGLGFIRKHFSRGYDGVSVYRLDEDGLFRGTAWFRRLGPFALAALTVRRILLDWARLVRHRRQIGIRVVALPAYAMVGASLRLIELVGGSTAFFRRT